ncbi:hypothetical protein P43SY_003100 [Pythium insidiosum]|uniref:Uncharacterized protein n=1 Tax=Pythium insidiosum TaxID=114742 RepID=A0AAD5LPL7_PYTIN|nr:hypothetical protein P43SY_003100 [Pythium insidiosum]
MAARSLRPRPPARDEGPRRLSSQHRSSQRWRVTTPSSLQPTDDNDAFASFPTLDQFPTFGSEGLPSPFPPPKAKQDTQGNDDFVDAGAD